MHGPTIKTETPKKLPLRCADHWIKMWSLFTSLPDGLEEAFADRDLGRIKELVAHALEVAGSGMFASGNVEKVALGACRGAMSAPSILDIGWFREVHEAVGNEYGLLRYEYPRVKRVECWLVDTESTLSLLKRGINDNVTRAHICGIRAEFIDENYVLEAPQLTDGQGNIR